MSLGLGVGPEMRTDVMPTVDEEIAQASEFVPPANTTQWLQLGLGGTSTMGDNELDSGSDGEDHTGYKDEALKRRAEQKYNEARELDLMEREDELSIKVENFQENACCNNFLQHFQRIVETNVATEDDKAALLKLNAIIKPINSMDILDTLKTSWKQLDEIILETAAREKARAEMEVRLRTEEGMKRQNTILEHSEDIEELADFLHVAGLSKSNAKRVATELVLRNISTPKKMAKLWARQQVVLSELGIDADDAEEVEAALRQLLMNASASTADMFHTHSQSGFPNNNSISWGPTTSAMSPFDSAYLPANSASLLQLDPAMVTEVAETDVDYEEDEQADQVASPVRSPLKRSASTKAFSFTKEGYKSFVGGWVECYTDEGTVYYYNTASGESSWHIPGAREEDEEELVEDLREEAPPAPAYHDDAAAHQQEPSNTFALTYDEHAYQDPNYYYDEHGQLQYYDPNQSQQQQYYDPNQSQQQQYYDGYDQTQYPAADGNGYYDPSASQGYNQSYDEPYPQHQPAATAQRGPPQGWQLSDALAGASLVYTTPFYLVFTTVLITFLLIIMLLQITVWERECCPGATCQCPPRPRWWCTPRRRGSPDRWRYWPRRTAGRTL